MSTNKRREESVFSFSELNIQLVWVDGNIEDVMCRRYIKRLQNLDSGIKTFQNPEDCISFIKDYERKQSPIPINLIVSGRLAEITISRVERYRCVMACYIFCKDRSINETLRFGKLRSVCIDITELLKDIEYFNIKRDEKLGISIFKDPESNSNDQAPQRRPQTSLEDEVRFMWNFQCYKFMVNLDDTDDHKAKREMYKYLKEKVKTLSDSPEKENYLKKLQEFNEESIEVNKEKAITWYTVNSLFYRFTNEALRQLKTKDIYAVRFMIKIICQRLEELRRESKDTKGIQEVFRGQVLSKKALDCIEVNCGNFLSFKSFVSSSQSEEIAEAFYQWKSRNDDVFAIFQIDISRNVREGSSAVFVDISKESVFKREREVLFSVGTMFRIISVKRAKDDTYRIRLSLTNREEVIFNDYIEKIYKIHPDRENSSLIFGKLLYDMNEVELAHEHFLNSYNKLRSNKLEARADHLVNIGACQQKLNRYDEAVAHYQKAIEIYTRTDHRQGIGICNYHLAVLFGEQEKFDEAHNHIMIAIKAQKRYPLEKATSLDFQGSLNLKEHEYQEAKRKFEEAKTIRDRYLSESNPHHPELGISYKNLGAVEIKLENFDGAIKNYEKASQIFSHNYPSDDPRKTDINAILTELKRHS